MPQNRLVSTQGQDLGTGMGAGGPKGSRRGLASKLRTWSRSGLCSWLAQAGTNHVLPNAVAATACCTETATWDHLRDQGSSSEGRRGALGRDPDQVAHESQRSLVPTAPDMCAQDHQPLRASHAELWVRGALASLCHPERCAVCRRCAGLWLPGASQRGDRCSVTAEGPSQWHGPINHQIQSAPVGWVNIGRRRVRQPLLSNHCRRDPADCRCGRQPPTKTHAADAERSEKKNAVTTPFVSLFPCPQGDIGAPIRPCTAAFATTSGPLKTVGHATGARPSSAYSLAGATCDRCPCTWNPHLATGQR